LKYLGASCVHRFFVVMGITFRGGGGAVPATIFDRSLPVPALFIAVPRPLAETQAKRPLTPWKTENGKSCVRAKGSFGRFRDRV